MSTRRDVVIGSVAAAAASSRAYAADPLKLTLGTATPGGGFPVYGAAFVETVQEADPGLAIEARNTKGSAENIPLLETGAIDLGLVQGEPASEALEGRGRPASRLKVVTAMYATAGLFVVRADSPVRRIEDLRGKRVALGAKGSGLTVMGRLVLAGLGLDPDRDVEPVLLDRAGDGPAMVLDGRVAALFGGGAGWPGFTAVAAAPGGARFLAPGEEGAARILAANPAMRRLTVAAGTYPGLGEPLVSVGSWSLVLSRADLPDEAGYRLARALDRGREAIAKRLPQGSETHPANTVAAVRPDWLHPGAARYLREARYLG